MKISLIIPAYNEEKYIGACLESAMKNAPGAFHEILVVDNASTDATAEVAKRFAGVRVLHESQKGPQFARQRGLMESSGDLVAYIDADVLIPPRWSDTAILFFQKHPRAVSLSGPYKYYDGSRIQNLMIETLWKLSAPTMYFFVGYMVLGGNLIAKREALMAIGGFNTNISFYGDDTDTARRLHARGKVAWRMSFFAYTSSRRWSKEGIFKTAVVYGLNFIWEVLFHKPYSASYTDVRFPDEK